MHTSGSILLTSWDDGVASPFMKRIRKRWSVEVQKLPSEAFMGLGLEEGWSSSPTSPSTPLSTYPVTVLAIPILLCIYQFPGLEHDTAATYLQSCPTPHS